VQICGSGRRPGEPIRAAAAPPLPQKSIEKTAMFGGKKDTAGVLAAWERASKFLELQADFDDNVGQPRLTEIVAFPGARFGGAGAKILSIGKNAMSSLEGKIGNPGRRA